MNRIDKFEKEAEEVLPKKINKEVKRHYLLYILGALLILVLAGYFAITYAKDIKDTKRQQDLLQQQINLQKSQLDAQNKQIEDAKKSTTTAPPAITVPKTTTPTTPTCNKAKQQDQINVLEALISSFDVATENTRSKMRQYEAKLQEPGLSQEDINYYNKEIDTGSHYIVTNNTNKTRREEELALVKKCSLMTDTLIETYRAGTK